jgi:antitoxin ParD1/3/4
VPTRNISLTDEQDAFVDEIVRAGEHQNASEAMRDALRALQQRRRHDELKLELLRAHLQLGTDALDQGDFVDIDEGDLDRYVSGLVPAKPRRARRKRAR